MGLGVIRVGLWLVLLVWALTARRSWFWRPNPWFASVVLVVLSLGVLAFFEAGQGALAGFTNDGEVSLGGDVGESIIGSSTWQGVLRLLGIFFLGLAAIAPVLAADLSVRVGKRTPGAFALVATGAGRVVEKYRLDQRFRVLGRKANVAVHSSNVGASPGEMPPHALITEAPNAIEWSRPPGDILVDAPEVRITDEEIAHNSESIKQTLAEYGVEVEVGQTWSGPTVTIYGLTPGWVRRYKQVRERDAPSSTNPGTRWLRSGRKAKRASGWTASWPVRKTWRWRSRRPASSSRLRLWASLSWASKSPIQAPVQSPCAT